MQPEVQDSIEFFEWTLNNEKIDRIQNIKIEKTTKISYNLKTRKLPNLIVNGDFENGDRDFRTQYELSPSKCSGGGFSFCEGAYAITSNPQNNHSLYFPCNDRINTRGNMMLINGATAKQNVWCQTISLTPNKEYAFSFWGALAFPDDAPAELKISIDNGVSVKNFLNKKNQCEWSEFKIYLNSNNKSSIDICITNETTAIGGNDFLIDDIALYRLETKSDSVIIDHRPLLLSIEGPESVNCKDITPKELDAVSNQNELDYAWETTNGKILGSKNEQSLIIGSGGDYKVTIVDKVTNCQNNSEINIPTVFDGASNLFYPNIVSLNAQLQVNKSFIITLDNECAENRTFNLEIFDRWGNMVFQKKNSSELIWNLRFNDQNSAQGTYTFIVSTTNENTINVVTKGSFTIVD
ncbi:MAG: gliding motility-associated C-terminal domain-containing protein [Saprospiraceae bacterium]|nr:gliding motility-associated C-terminal domain-containing protein [Saprospiraceae bacterium]